MNEPPAALIAALLPSDGSHNPVASTLWIAAALALSGFFGTLRAALNRSLPSRLLARAEGEQAQARFESLLERVDRLAISAGIFKITCDLTFVALLVGWITAEAFDFTNVALAVAIAAPSLLLLTEALPASVATAWGDGLLLRTLRLFHIFQLPVAWIVIALEALRGAVLRALHIKDDAHASRKLVEGLREVAAGVETSELAQSEKELIENVLDFRGVDAAEVMTPRTEISGAEVDTSLEDVARLFAEVGRSRIPVYEDSMDNIIGTVSALAVTEALFGEESQRLSLRDLLRPPLLVPETIRISELLETFRGFKQKMAIIVDEYGGTAGLVTLGDVLEELVGEIQDEFEGSEESVREVRPGLFEVLAGLHVSEVNEALGLAIPEEEDYETLGGFVLAELGRLPNAGESFLRDEVTYSVAEASDRRVLKVRVQRSA